MISPFALALLAVASSPQASEHRTRCGAALAAAALFPVESRERFLFAPPEKPREPIRTADGKLTSEAIKVSSAVWRRGWQGEHPTRRMVIEWVNSNLQGLGRCSITGESQLIFTENTSYEGSYVGVSFPETPMTKSRVLLFVDQVGKGLSGRRMFIIMQFINGRWFKVGERPISVS